MKNVFAILAPAVLPYHSPFWWTVDYMVLPIALNQNCSWSNYMHQSDTDRIISARYSGVFVVLLK